ncbi:MAG: T9SS type A sorting domain-containing protein [Ignavibacteriales bacterium]|nr:T9SS type A sorting domain-containing protein [Ignavibacteriales bacterium]
MKSVQLATIVFSIVFIGFTLGDPPTHDSENTDVISCTELNGLGCVCHTIDQDTTVLTRVEGPKTLRPGETAKYRVYVSRGPALGGGFNVASRFGSLATVDSTVLWLDNELTQKFPLAMQPGDTAIHWDFYYTAPLNKLKDTIYSVGLSTNHDYMPNEFDLWAYGPKFVVEIARNATSVEDDMVPGEFAIKGNYPNPFNPSTTIVWVTPDQAETKITVFDAAGREVGVYEVGVCSAGKNEFKFNASSLASGLYFYRIKSGTHTAVNKFILLK